MGGTSVTTPNVLSINANVISGSKFMLHARHVNIVTDEFRQNFVSAIVSV